MTDPDGEAACEIKVAGLNRGGETIAARPSHRKMSAQLETRTHLGDEDGSTIDD